MHLELNVQNYVFYAVLLVFCIWNTISTYKVRDEIGLEYKSKKHDIKITNKPILILLIALDILLFVEFMLSIFYGI